MDLKQLFESVDEKSQVSVETGEGDCLDDPKAKRRLLRKLDLRVLPILMVLWFLAFVDRVNIANAKVQHMEKSLGMKGNDYNVALTVFFATFIACEVPLNTLLGARIPWLTPGVLLGSEVFCLALFTIGEGVIKTYGGIIAMRVMVGAFEAALVPGSVLLLSNYYPRYHLQWRVSILAVANALASAFGGLLATGINEMNGDLHRESWRWVFIIEGAITAVAGLASIFLIVDWPDKATFLNEKEKKLIRHLIAKDCHVFARMDHLTKDAIKRCVTDWKIWINVPIYAFTGATTYTINLFAPTIIQGLNSTYTPRKILLLTAPIFLVSAVFCLASAWMSDRFRHRSGFIITGYLISIIGFGILLAPKGTVSESVRYLALYIISSGNLICIPIMWTLLANNVSGIYKTAFASSMQIASGGIGGIIAGQAYRAKDAPMYHTGNVIIFTPMLVAMLLVVVFVGGIALEKKVRREGKRDHRLNLPNVDNIGDDHPHFEFTY